MSLPQWEVPFVQDPLRAIEGKWITVETDIWDNDTVFNSSIGKVTVELQEDGLCLYTATSWNRQSNGACHYSRGPWSGRIYQLSGNVYVATNITPNPDDEVPYVIVFNPDRTMGSGHLFGPLSITENFMLYRTNADFDVLDEFFSKRWLCGPGFIPVRHKKL